MSKAIFKMICAFCLAGFMVVGERQAQAQDTEACQETDPNQFFSLINAPVQSYIPPLDRNGNTILSENDVFIQKSRHYFAELKDFPEVTISMERFASVTENNPTALENFESKITILGPDCSKVNMYRSRLVGSFTAPFKQIMGLIELGIRTNNEAITQFATSQLTPTTLNFEQIVGILANDLALNVDVVNNMLPLTLRSQFLAEEEDISLNSLSEMALLAFSSMGGAIDSNVRQIYVFVPKSMQGVDSGQETVILTSDARLYGIQGFDYDVAGKVLSRMGVRTSIVSLSEIKTDKFGSCKIDIAGQWMQIINGKKVRSCPFTELVRQMLEDGAYSKTEDYKHQEIVFDGISRVLAQKNDRVRNLMR